MTLPRMGLNLPPLLFQCPSEFSSDEASRAKEYFAGLGVQKFYLDDAHWAKYIAEQVILLEPASVFEFGCNRGRNLMEIRKLDANIQLAGVDVNPDAVAWGRDHHGLDLRVGDESLLGSMEGQSFDVTFTLSVLDHLPDPRPVLKELIRVARKGVILLEPWLGQEGKVVQTMSTTSGKSEDAEPYEYSWDYVKIIHELSPEREVSWQHYDMGAGSMKRWWSASYCLFVIR